MHPFARSRLAAPRERCPALASRSPDARRRGQRRILAVGQLGVILALSLSGVPLALSAPNEDAARRNAALELGSEGLALFEQERFAEALERFERANELLPAPTLGIRAARSLAKLGRLVEASERYLEVTRFPLGNNPQRVQVEAVRQARRELDGLMQTVPTLTVKVPGADPDRLAVEVDDARLPDALIGHAQPVDPGKHRIVVESDGLIVEERPTLQAGERMTMIVRGPTNDGVSVAPRPSTTLPQWAIGGFAVGVAGLTLGTINGAVAIAQNESLEDRCPARNCPPGAHDDADHFDAARALTTGGFVVGGLGVAAGAVLLVLDAAPWETDPSAPKGRRPWSRTRLLPTGNGLRLVF